MFLTITTLDPAGGGPVRWARRWEPALSAFGPALPGLLDRARRGDGKS